MEITSSAFASGETIPTRYTCEGVDVSPPLQWTGVPDEAESLTLICDDPDAPGGTWSHWVLYDLPADTNQLEEGVPSGGEPDVGGTQGRNDFGDVQYGGPCPPPGPAHRYYFRLYALDEKLRLPPGATRQKVLDRLQDHSVAEAELMGRYGRT